MAISNVRIKDMGPFAGDHSYDLPAVVVLTGGNGKGKTGFQDCLAHCLGKGHDPEMLYGKSEVATIRITLSDGNEIQCRTTAEGTTRGWRPKDGKRWEMNRKLIDDISNALAFNPAEFMAMKEADAAAYLLKLAPIEVAPEEIEAAVGSCADVAVNADLSTGNGIEILDNIRDKIFKERTLVNAEASASEAHSMELRKALPTTNPTEDWPAAVARIRKQKEDGEELERVKVSDLKVNIQASVEALKEERFTKSLEIDRVFNEAHQKLMQQVKDLEYKVNEDKRDLDAEYAPKIARMQESAQAQTEAIHAAHAPKIAELASELARAELLASQEATAKGTRLAAESAESVGITKRARAAELTAAIVRLDDLKKKLTERLKIPGVMVVGGKIVREEGGGYVARNRWNTADQLKLALRIAMMTGDKAGICMLDNFESFDGVNQAAILATARRRARDEGKQFILAEVDHKAGGFRIVDLSKEPIPNEA